MTEFYRVLKKRKIHHLFKIVYTFLQLIINKMKVDWWRVKMYYGERWVRAAQLNGSKVVKVQQWTNWFLKAFECPLFCKL